MQRRSPQQAVPLVPVPPSWAERVAAVVLGLLMLALAGGAAFVFLVGVLVVVGA